MSNTEIVCIILIAIPLIFLMYEIIQYLILHFKEHKERKKDLETIRKMKEEIKKWYKE